MVEATVEAAAGRVPVVAGILSTGFKEAVQAARDFTAAGADGLMLVTPYYVIPTQEAIREYFQAFAQAVTVPVMLYDIPTRTGVAVKAETIAQMAEDRSIIGMKACNPDFNQFARLIGLAGEKISVLSGEEPFFATHVAMGAHGGILATANLFPKAWQEMFALASAGNLKGALAAKAAPAPPRCRLRRDQPRTPEGSPGHDRDAGRPRPPPAPAAPARHHGRSCRAIDLVQGA